MFALDQSRSCHALNDAAGLVGTELHLASG